VMCVWWGGAWSGGGGVYVQKKSRLCPTVLNKTISGLSLLHIQTRKPQGDFRGTECILQLLLPEKQEHRGKNLTSLSAWGVQDCRMQNTAAGPQWVWQ